jgi:integrase
MLAELARHRTRTGQPYAPRSIAIARGTLRKALAAAVPSRIPSNPAAEVPLPRARGSAPKVGVEIPVPSVTVLRAVEHRLRVAGDPLHPLFVVASATGLRQSELLGLRWSAIDLDAGALEVRDVLLRDTHEIDDPKSRSSARRVKLHPMIVAVLRSRRQAQRVERIAAGRRWSREQGERDLVFTDRLGEPLKGRQVTRRLQAALRALGLPSFDWKSLRHAYVTGLLEDGVDLAIVSKSAGHSSIDITGDVYAHFTARMQETVADSATARVLGS